MIATRKEYPMQGDRVGKRSMMKSSQADEEMENIATEIGHKLLLGFLGTDAPPHILRWLAERPLGGFTLFRYRNIENPAQIRQLTSSLQQAAHSAGYPPLLICADQEGGQLQALGSALTPFPGNMALGATGDVDLAYQMGLAMGRECAALGVNVDYAPSCDVNSNPQNPVIGIRSFGEDAGQVARLAAAMAQGLQAAGVVSAVKHFPGHGDTVTDSHDGIPVLAHDEERLWDVELRPFTAAIDAGAKIVMSAHVGIPALNNGRIIPSTLSPAVLQGLLRQKMNFQGVILSDAMDMSAIAQDEGFVGDALTAVRAGVDMLLMTDNSALQEATYQGLVAGVEQDTLDQLQMKHSVQRILALKQWIAAQTQPDLEVVGCQPHRALAQEIANRAVTLVRDEAGLLPLGLPANGRIALIVPEFQNLTPADTSASEKMTLGSALRKYHPYVDEYIVPQRPCESIISTFRERIEQYDLVIIGTIEAVRQPEQAALVNALLDTAVPLIVVALRTPYDLAVFPRAQTYACTYSIQEPAMQAVAAALWGEIPFQGKLPVQIPGLYPVGFSINR